MSLPRTQDKLPFQVPCRMWAAQGQKQGYLCSIHTPRRKVWPNSQQLQDTGTPRKCTATHETSENSWEIHLLFQWKILSPPTFQYISPLLAATMTQITQNRALLGCTQSPVIWLDCFSFLDIHRYWWSQRTSVGDKSFLLVETRVEQTDPEYEVSEG